MSYTTEQKYKWLLSQLQITDIDWWENDAFLSANKKWYFQFPSQPLLEATPAGYEEDVLDINKAVERCMENDNGFS